MPAPLLVFADGEARDARSVPRAVLDRAVVLRKERIREIGRGDPVAGIRRIGIAAVAVIRYQGIGDEVVSRQRAARQFGVIRDSGVDDRDHHRSRAMRQVPGRERVDAARRTVEEDLLAHQRIVRDHQPPAHAVRLREQDVGVRREPRSERARFAHRQRAEQRHDLRAQRHVARMRERDARVGRECRHAHRRREPGAFAAVAELDDELRRRQARPIARRRSPRRAPRRARRAEKCGAAPAPRGRSSLHPPTFIRRGCARPERWTR